jgi:UPF0755 protein
MSLKINNKLMAFLKKGKWLLVDAGIVVIATLICCFNIYNALYKSNIKKSGVIYIATGSGFQQLVDTLNRNGYIDDIKTFKWVSSLKKYDQRVQPGAYTLKSGWCNNQLINLLRAGIQTPVKVTFNNIRFREELAGRLARFLEPDSAAFLKTLNSDKTANDLGLTCESFPVIIIPNTYEIYWNTTPQEFVGRMKREFDQFWNEARKKKASELSLTQLEIVTIASIIQEETNKNDEKSRMAGVYINRLKRGWLLQADPTVKYALGNFLIKRVLTEYLSVNSPYNTYKYAGLPPGPINFPSISSIDAVLNAERHNFMYFCAKEDFSGFHNFALSLSEHSRNAARYQSALNKNKIWK